MVLSAWAKSYCKKIFKGYRVLKKAFKQTGLAIAFAATALFGTQAALAAPMVLTNGSSIRLGYDGSPWGGGGFNVTGVNVTGDQFWTFCLEYNEHFSPGSTPYYVQINTGAVNGGLTNAGTYAGDPNGTTNFDPLSKATAWLYTQYRSGTLSTLSNALVTPLPGSEADENALQLAIWKLEGELTGSAATTYNNNSVGTVGAQAQAWVAAAIAGGNTWSDTGNVRVLNLYSSYSNGNFSGASQDQLYLVPVPEPVSLSLLGLGLVALGFAKRRKQNAA